MEKQMVHKSENEHAFIGTYLRLGAELRFREGLQSEFACRRDERIFDHMKIDFFCPIPR